MTTTSSSTAQIAQSLVDLCNAGDNMRALDTLYHDDIVSVEAHNIPGMDREMRGIDAIRAKNQWWYESNEVHERNIAGPFQHGDDRFALSISYEVTPRQGPGAGQRAWFNEVGVYTVRDGKIAREEYFYAPQGGDA